MLLAVIDALFIYSYSIVFTRKVQYQRREGWRDIMQPFTIAFFYKRLAHIICRFKVYSSSLTLSVASNALAEPFESSSSFLLIFSPSFIPKAADFFSCFVFGFMSSFEAGA